MTTLEPEQKDILEKLNEIALETNWGTVERVDGVPKTVAVIQEAMEEIKRLRELPKEILGEVGKIEFDYYPLSAYASFQKVLKKYGVTLDEKIKKIYSLNFAVFQNLIYNRNVTRKVLRNHSPLMQWNHAIVRLVKIRQ